MTSPIGSGRTHHGFETKDNPKSSAWLLFEVRHQYQKWPRTSAQLELMRAIRTEPGTAPRAPQPLGLETMMIDQEWLPSPGTWLLFHNEVHVWRAALDVPAPRLHAFERTLTPDEQNRAAQFRFPHLRRRFIAGRGILRAILSGYLGVAPETIQFGYTSYGKPFLVMCAGWAALSFNVTHTREMALYAVAEARAVGVDI